MSRECPFVRRRPYLRYEQVQYRSASKSQGKPQNQKKSPRGFYWIRQPEISRSFGRSLQLRPVAPLSRHRGYGASIAPVLYMYCTVHLCMYVHLLCTDSRCSVPVGIRRRYINQVFEFASLQFNGSWTSAMRQRFFFGFPALTSMHARQKKSPGRTGRKLLVALKADS